MANIDPTNGAGAVGKVVNGEMFAFLGRFAALLCVPLIGWVLITMVGYGNAMARLDGQIAVLTTQITGLTTQLQNEVANRYTAADAARDFAYRDSEIKGLTDHLIDAEHDISNLKDRVSKTEVRR